MADRFPQYALALAVAAVLVVGCSGKPNASTGRRVVEQQIADNSNGLLKLISFKKVNGTEAEPMGVKIYEMEYEAEIARKKDTHSNLVR